MARVYNEGPFNCGRYQAEGWDTPCDKPPDWTPGPECPGNDFTEVECPGNAFTEQVPADPNWTAVPCPDNEWVEDNV